MEKKKFSIEKIQDHAFEASVVNAKQANEAMKSYQSWLLILCTTELAFLGTLILNEEVEYICLVKALIILILISFFAFIFGGFYQFKDLVKVARNHEKRSNVALEYLKKNIREVEEIPRELEISSKQINSSRKANIGFSIFLFLTIAVNLGVLLLIILI